MSSGSTHGDLHGLLHTEDGLGVGPGRVLQVGPERLVHRLALQHVGVAVRRVDDVGADAARRELGREVVDVLRQQPLRDAGRPSRPGRRRGCRFLATSISAAVEPVAMIEAPSLRCGSATWMALMVPIRLVLMHVDPGLQSRLDPSCPRCRPAATTMSSLPNSARPSSSALRSWAASRTSAFAVTIRWPVFSTNCAVSSRSSGVAIG